MIQVVGGLTDDAFSVVMSIGEATLAKPDGLDNFMTAMETYVGAVKEDCYLLLLLFVLPLLLSSISQQKLCGLHVIIPYLGPLL